jgi:hypothetical protein
MSHGVQHLFNALVAGTAAFGSAVPLLIRKGLGQ